MRLVSVVGARPQFVKLAPIGRELTARRAGGQSLEHLVVHTGQHYDRAMSEVFFSELGLPEPTINLEAGSGSHAQQTARMLTALEEFYIAQKPDVVLVYGDTNSTLAGALAASKLGLSVAHIEAGLRSFDRRMPEEQNRIAADHLCDLLLAPTEVAVANLGREGLEARTSLVGDVMLDAVIHNSDLAKRRSTVLDQLELDGIDYAVATLHRAGNTEHRPLAQLLDGLNRVAELIPVVLPMHPRTRSALRGSAETWKPAADLLIVDPLPYLDMLRIVDAAAIVLTDSGGLQKEAFILGRPCVTLRNETEWTETVTTGANVLVGKDAARMSAAVEDWRTRDWGRSDSLGGEALRLYGEGRAAGRIVDAVTLMRAPSN